VCILYVYMISYSLYCYTVILAVLLRISSTCVYVCVCIYICVCIIRVFCIVYQLLYCDAGSDVAY
jgi:hypothetical protein